MRSAKIWISIFSMLAFHNKAVSSFIQIQQENGRYFLKIPDDLLNKDLMIVTRIAKAGATTSLTRFREGLTGDKINENVIQFCKGPGNKMLLKLILFSDRSMDSTSDGLFEAVKNENFQPIASIFEVLQATDPKDSGISKVDITNFISNDNSILY